MSAAQRADHNRQKKIAAVNDLTGFGRCSLTVQIPIISKLRVQCCPVPTAILSNHTGFDSFYADDYTDHLAAYTAEWKKLGLTFSGIATGYLGSERQFGMVRNFIRDFSDEKTVVIVDPVMGDGGRTYASYSDEMCEGMRHLTALADLITPNLTEACILTGRQYHEAPWHREELEAMLHELRAMGPEKIVITGIPQGEFIASICLDGDGAIGLTRQYRVGEQRCGTGDVFASVIAADAVNGVNFAASVKKASAFVKSCILNTIRLGIPSTDGVSFEEVLDSLH